MTCYVGIDIAAKSVDVALSYQNKSIYLGQFKQNSEGFEALYEKLRHYSSVHIVMEFTGIYYFNLATYLVDKAFLVSIINPKSFFHFAKATLSNVKTDARDATLLARYAQCYQPDAWLPPQTAYLHLRDVGRQLNRLTTSLTRAKNRLHALYSSNESSHYVIDDEVLEINQLTQRIERLTDHAMTLIRQDEQLAKTYQHFISAKGVGETTALAVLAELCLLPQTMKSSQVSRYAGLDICITQSGTSGQRPSRISKAGNSYLRHALYMACLSATRFEPRTKAFYQALQQRGKKKMQALVAVMRKYLTGLWACLKNGENFNATKLFSDIHFEKMSQ